MFVDQQISDYVKAYQEMEIAVEAGKVRSIGLSNFDEHLDEILNICKIKPAVLQVEFHPYCNQDDLRNKIKSYGTII